MQSVFGIAKNVNGRRAASAYHLLPGASNTNSPATAPGDPQPLAASTVASPFDGVTLPLLKTSPSSSLASSFSSSSLTSLSGLESTQSSSSRLGTPTNPGNADLVRLNSSPFISIKTAELEQQDGPVNKHGSVVDKTNPFIGYFQTGRDTPPPSVAKTGLPPRSTSGAPAAPVTTPYATLLSQPKRIADWIGSQSTRLPSLFSKRDASENTSQAQRASQSAQQEQDNGESDGLKSGTSLLSSLKAAANSLGALSRQDSETRSLNGTAESPAPITALSLKAATSRFAQDFEVLESLGQGGQGAVFKARSKVDGCVYAIKQVMLSNAALDDAAELEQARREAVSMAAIPPHNNVVRYHTAWIEVEPVERVSSSTASVRGSDVPSDDESLGMSLSMSARHEDNEEDDNEDTSFSLGTVDSTSAYATFENSFGGFEFEDPSQSMMSFTTGKCDSRSHAAAASDAKLTGVGKSKLTLYIQMELCSTTVPSIARADETFDRFVDRLQQRPTSPRQEQYSNLTQWLRSSIDERSGPHARRAAKHTEGLKLFLGVAQGVSHMHSVGVIHRDLKPDNIFIHGDVAKVGDFGLSKSIFADTKSAATHPARERFGSGDEYGDHTTALGTFTYASPEQLGHRFNKSSKDTSRVKSAKYSVKSDIFALGVMLLELCCPFGTMMERSQVLTAVRHGVVPQTALQRYPTEMALVLRMTAVDPAERPSAEEICEQMRSLLIARNAISARSALDEFRDLQAKLALAVHQLRDRSQSTLQLESLVAEMNDKLQLFGSVLA